jgi:hypothetical protein
MKFILLVFMFFLNINIFCQERIFQFESIDVRTSDGWDVKEIKGKVVFYEDNKTSTITISTEHRINKMYVKSKQIFIRQYNFIYTLIDDYDNESSVRVILDNISWDYVTFYFYSDRLEEKYFRLCLTKK